MVVELDVPAGVAPGASIGWHPVPAPHGPAQQYTAGRRAAAAALASAGSAEATVPRERDGRPCFPSGFAGSISHTDNLAVALVVPGAEAVGVDIESGAVGPRMTRFILGERERHVLLPPVGAYTPRELFAAKEAAFKALNGTGSLGDFLFWRIELSQADGALTATYRGEPVVVWVRSKPDFSFAVAIRH
ncbi:4'-phosphopantetheinyl transferase superfamily protein [Streptomyces coelicoflavus]|uniref:4'-phosphopantetheinyl transferase superfamily protein n=1 Tax=Streptomyces coelicoflavus TaxID=285562 RepID=UPI0036BC67CF